MVEIHLAVSKETSVPVPPHASRTSRTRRSLIAPAFVAVAALTLVACSSTEPPVEEMPLANVYTALDAMAGQSLEETRAHYAAQNVERENLVSRCMADLGFDYAPNPSSMVGQYFGFDHDSGEQQGTVAYAKTYGYDVFTGDANPITTLIKNGHFADPNAATVAAMSQAELEAWEAALYGVSAFAELDPQVDPETVEDPWLEIGCAAWAQQEVDGETAQAELSALREDPRFSELFDALAGISQKVSKDPEVVATTLDWAGCMSNAGYDFATPMDAMFSIFDLQQQLWDTHIDDPSYEGATESDLAPLAAQEIETAVADATCQESEGLREATLVAQRTAEEALVETYSDTIDELKAASELARS